MSLYQIWKENPAQIREKRVDQIIGFAGDGKLGDNNSAPAEFRAFLARVSADMLAGYAEDCLASGFKDSGLALQDIVNEMAIRIGFVVEPGRYRGTKNEIGHDGIWTGPDGHTIVAEVKTTDAYRLPIETVASYRRRLISSGRLKEDSSSILVIVGREDTGEVEAQIRGSRHAWDVRLISIDALVRLMKIRQELDDPGAEARIRSLLVPREYTRVDEIIDLVFSTTEDILEEGPEDSGELEGQAGREAKERESPVSFNAACATRISKHLGVDLTKQSRITFADLDAGLTVTCSVSKEYEEAKGAGYWFAFHPHQLDKLSESDRAYAAFGCGSAAQIALLPLAYLRSQLDGMNQTHRDDGRSYWHIQIHREADRWVLHRRKEEDWPDISDMMLLMSPPTT
jgi:hypothetical protein